jgi:hypothetical protein
MARSTPAVATRSPSLDASGVTTSIHRFVAAQRLSNSAALATRNGDRAGSWKTTPSPLRATTTT